jgi:hypothetical protein
MLVDLIVVIIIMTRVEVLIIRVVFERWPFTTGYNVCKIECRTVTSHTHNSKN